MGQRPVRRPGRFVATLGTSTVLDGLAGVALKASQDDRTLATAISKAAWDQARLGQGRLELPTADAIRRRAGVPWNRVVQLALTEASERTTLLGQWDGSNFAGWGPDGGQQALRALRAVALRIGRTPTPFEYDEAAREMQSESKRRRVSRALILPRSVYIVKTHGSWNQALQQSGLKPPETRLQRRVTPALAESLDRFIEDFAMLPNSVYFLEWCRRMDIPTPRVKGGWAAVLAQVRELRTVRGAAMPETATPSRELPALPEPLPARRRMPFRHSREAVLASLRRYGSLHLAQGCLPRQKHYLVACRQDPELIWPGHFSRHGRFHDLCREAGIE